MELEKLTLAAATALNDGNEPEAAHGVIGHSIDLLDADATEIGAVLVSVAIDTAVVVGDGAAADALVERIEGAPVPDDPMEAGSVLRRTARRKWSRGEAASALEAFTAARSHFAMGEHEREVAITTGDIADILKAQGDVEEALRIRREEELPVYERLGDVREQAVTIGKIADILRTQGDVEEALRIRREEQLPVFERLGDVREKSVVQFNIAQILLMTGGLEQGRIQEIFEASAEAYTAAVSLKIPDGISATGMLLAQILAIANEREKALDVLDAVAKAFEVLKNEQGLAQVSQLRQKIRENGGN